MSELDGPRGSIRIQHRSPQNVKGLQSQCSIVSGSFGPLSGHTGVTRKVMGQYFYRFIGMSLIEPKGKINSG